MKFLKSLMLTILLGATLMANEIQIFTKNTMEIELDPKTVSEKIYMGKYSDFMKDPAGNLSKGFTQAAANGAFMGALNSTSTINQAGKIDSGNIAAGGLGALAGYAIGSGAKWFMADNEYVYISLSVNSKGEKTMIQTLIVANNFLTDSTIEEIGKKELQAQMK